MTSISTTPPVAIEQTYSQDKFSPVSVFWNVQTGQPTQPLKKILDLTDVSETTLQKIVDVTQKRWLRSGERAIAADSPELLKIQPELLKHAEELKMKFLIEPENKHFSSALVMGSKIKVVEKRLQSVLDQIKEGKISIDTLSILSGERKLDQDEIDVLKPMGSDATDERDMMEFMTNKMVEEYKQKGLPTLSVVIVKASKKEGAVRATTEDTVNAWLQNGNNLSSQEVLIVSSQPYGYYQLLVSKPCIPNSVTLDLLAVETTESRAIIYLDTLARILFTINKSFK